MEKSSKFPPIHLQQLGGLDQSQDKVSLPKDAFSSLMGLYPREVGSLSRIPGKVALRKFSSPVLGIFQMFTPYGYGVTFIQGTTLQLGGWNVPDTHFDPTIREAIPPTIINYRLNFSANCLGTVFVFRPDLWSDDFFALDADAREQLVIQRALDQSYLLENFRDNQPLVDAIRQYDKIMTLWEIALRNKYIRNQSEAVDNFLVDNPLLPEGFATGANWQLSWFSPISVGCPPNPPGGENGFIPTPPSFGPPDWKSCSVVTENSQEFDIAPYLLVGTSSGGTASHFEFGALTRTTDVPIPAPPQLSAPSLTAGSSTFELHRIFGAQASYGRTDGISYALSQDISITEAHAILDIPTLLEDAGGFASVWVVFQYKRYEFFTGVAVNHPGEFGDISGIQYGPTVPNTGQGLPYNISEVRVNITDAMLAGIPASVTLPEPEPGVVDISKNNNRGDNVRTISKYVEVTATKIVVIGSGMLCLTAKQWRDRQRTHGS